MTTSLLAPPHISTRATPAAAQPARRHAWWFEVEGMDKAYRGSVEKLLLLLPEGTEGDVWFTRWRRSVDGTYSCRERIMASEAEVAEFERALASFARGKFMARLTQRAYHGVRV